MASVNARWMCFKERAENTPLLGGGQGVSAAARSTAPGSRPSYHVGSDSVLDLVNARSSSNQSDVASEYMARALRASRLALCLGDTFRPSASGADVFGITFEAGRATRQTEATESMLASRPA